MASSPSFIFILLALVIFLGPGFQYFLAKKYLREATDAARKHDFKRAMRLTRTSSRFDVRLRQCDPLHAFYAAIQSSPTADLLEERIIALEASLPAPTRSERAWSNPKFQIAMAVVVCALVLFRLTSILQ
jgi:hypothetical protein